MGLTALAPGKVNLSLLLGGRRADGRHEVVTLLEAVSLADELSVSPADADEVVCPGVEGSNLVACALARLRARGWNGPPVRVEIEKRVPVAAGMGGGSADAAAMLRLAHSLEPVPGPVVREIAVELGADVPSQLEPGVAIGTGAGDEVRMLPPLAPHGLVIVPPERPLPTAAVYAEADRLGLGRDGDELATAQGRLARGGRPPDELIVNDLEPAAVSLQPEIADVLDTVRAAGADHALVSGSGPTVFGLFWGEDGPARADAAARALAGSARADAAARALERATSATPVPAGFGRPRVRSQSASKR